MRRAGCKSAQGSGPSELLTVVNASAGATSSRRAYAGGFFGVPVVSSERFAAHCPLSRLETAFVAVHTYETTLRAQMLPTVITPRRRQELLVVCRLVNDAISRDTGVSRLDVDTAVLQRYTLRMPADLVVHAQDFECFIARNGLRGIPPR